MNREEARAASMDILGKMLDLTDEEKARATELSLSIPDGEDPFAHPEVCDALGEIILVAQQRKVAAFNRKWGERASH